LIPLIAVAAGWTVARVDPVRRLVLPAPEVRGEQSRGGNPVRVARAYDIRDLLPAPGARPRIADALATGLIQWKGPPPTARQERIEMIESIIEQLAGPADRRHGIQPEFRELGGTLIVVETPDVQERIGRMLRSLRVAGVGPDGEGRSGGDAR
jgi:hypothetical protein